MARTVSAKLCGQMWAWTHNLPQTYVRNSPPIGLKPNKHLRKFLQTLLHVPSLHVHVGLIYHLSMFLLITWLIRRLIRAFYACTNTHNPVNICKHATFGPLAKRHTNGALLVGRWWPDPMAFCKRVEGGPALNAGWEVDENSDSDCIFWIYLHMYLPLKRFS